MRFRAPIITITAVVTILGAVACGDGTEIEARGAVEAPEGPSAERLAALLRFPPADYNQEDSMAGIESVVDVVVVGALGNPRSGRSIYGSPDDPHPTIRTITFELTDVSILGGSRPEILSQDNAVVEFYAPNAMIGDDGLGAVEGALAPGQRGLFFLHVYDIAETTTVKGEDP